MSALPPKADICSAQAHVCFGQKRTLCHSFDQLIGAGEYSRRYRQAERLRGREIDDPIEFDRSLDGKISRLCSLEDPVDISCRPFEQVNHINTVADQSARGDKVTVRIHRW